jgi:hypothetical protein
MYASASESVNNGPRLRLLDMYICTWLSYVDTAVLRRRIPR